MPQEIRLYIAPTAVGAQTDRYPTDSHLHYSSVGSKSSSAAAEHLIRIPDWLLSWQTGHATAYSRAATAKPRISTDDVGCLREDCLPRVTVDYCTVLWVTMSIKYVPNPLLPSPLLLFMLLSPSPLHRPSTTTTTSSTSTMSRTKRIRSHLSSWVMLSPTTNPPYTPLPNEQTLFTSPPRIGFSLSTPSHYPGKQQQPYNFTNSTGILYITNRRIIYLPEKPSKEFQSFAAPILNLHDSHCTAPWFGPNVWIALLQPVQGGGIPTPSTGVLEIKLTFKEGGAFDFHTTFERVKERLQQAVEVSRISGDGTGSSRAAMNGVDVSNVNLEDLPAYQEESDGPLISPVGPPPAAVAATSQQSNAQRDSGIAVDEERPRSKPTEADFGAPTEPPPGYEETQIQGLQDEMDRRASEGARRS
ncbi:hypothetical protein D0859_08832 [Hortaea werneckii]|uniref:GRAM domain-containing protein n=1 Tax=Hortaea werneckii TaxID=91943 RepID=A0A3M7INT7_HORWE|nr:hypothetical protein D0859_08832 [Hortaea werneckii]